MNHRYFVAVYAGLGAALAIAILAAIERSLPAAVLMAPFGASAVLIFGLPDSPLAQAKNVVGGHLLTATIGLGVNTLLGVTPLSLALATGLAVSAMLLTRTTHPPAGANPILAMLSGESWGFLLFPVLLGSMLMVLCGRLMLWLKAVANGTKEAEGK
ncbi:HPP family protein [Gilvimarinus agarilyticus]|uniref:HPP family protein n=1 Tax=Gilvimarinus agarilyticus TaxID=679259 RepID=UPI0005A11B4E|nr:HPP family protein [Gilvimarinus agarilyticus]